MRRRPPTPSGVPRPLLDAAVRRTTRSAVTLVELLMVISVISVLGAVAYVNYLGSKEQSESAKLESDVRTLNSAVVLYLGNGGNFTGEETAEQVLEKLKTSSSAASAAGLTGSFIDLRVKAVGQTAAEGASSSQRARWVGSDNRFVIATNGAAGIREFVLDEALALEERSPEARSNPVVFSTNSDWIWNYTNATAASTNLSAPSPVSTQMVRLSPPTFSPPSGNRPLTEFQPTLPVTISNPNPAGVIYYSAAGGPRTQYSGGAVALPPGANLIAWVESTDSRSWINSETASASYSPTPHQLTVDILGAPEAITFRDAGGEIAGLSVLTPAPATFQLNLDGIHPDFISDAHFQVAVGMGAGTPSSSGSPSFSGAFVSPEISFTWADWGADSILSIHAVAETSSPYFVSSAPAQADIAISPTAIAAPTISPPAGAIEGTVQVSLAPASNSPVGTRIFYSIDSTELATGPFPSGGQLYSVPFSTGAATVRSRAYGPAGTEHWFAASTLLATTYYTPSLPTGALVASASIYGSGTFVGNLTYAAPPAGTPMNTISFYSDTIIKGNLYLPGLPDLYVNWKGPSQKWTTSNDALFANYILGKEFDETGVEVVPATETPFPRVKQYQPPGPTTPVYDLFFYGNSKIEGKVFRQYSLGTLPTVPPPATKTNNNTVSYSSWDFNPSNPNPAPSVVNPAQYANVNLNTNLARIPLLPGAYGNIAASSNSAVILGDPNNPDVVQDYSFQSLSLTGGADLVVVGKVRITVSSTISIYTDAVMGNPAHPEWLQVNFYSTNTPTQWNVPRQFHSANNAQFYGSIVAPKGEVALDGSSIFQGAVTSYRLQITSNSVLFLLPPVISP